jgi:hypothetical protein
MVYGKHNDEEGAEALLLKAYPDNHVIRVLWEGRALPHPPGGSFG